MSQIHVNQIAAKLRKSYPEHIDQSIETQDPYYTNSRLLAYWSLDKVAQQKAGESVTLEITDGENDRGIDAVGVDLSENILILTQSKWRKDGSGSIDQADMLKFLAGVKFLLDMSPTEDEMRVASKLVESDSYDDIKEVINEPGVKIYLVAVTTGANELSEVVRGEVDSLLRMLNENDPDDPMAEFIYLNQSEIYKMISGKKKEVSFKLPVLDYGFYKDEVDKTVYYGRVVAENISEIYKENQQNLFSDNLRVGISRSDINNGIRNSVTNEPENFFLYNNGITIIAEDIIPSGNSSRQAVNLSLKNASIVNGAQTVSTLGKLETDSDELSRASVLVRCIKVPKEENSLAKKITRYANTQNVVSNQDFAYLDENQHRLVTELNHEGYSYHLRSSEKLASDDNEKVITLREAATALACANSNIKYPVIAKGAVGKLFDTSDVSGNYYSIFNNGTRPELLIRSVLVLRAVEKELEQKKKDHKNGPRRGVAINARFLITHLILQNVPMNILLNSDLSMNEFLNDVPSKAVEYWDKMSAVFESESGELKDVHPGNVFKNQSRVQQLISDMN